MTTLRKYIEDTLGGLKASRELQLRAVDISEIIDELTAALALPDDDVAEAELAALEADKRRLEWIAYNQDWLILDNTNGEWRVLKVPDAEGTWVDISGKHKDFRAAIDFAIDKVDVTPVIKEPPDAA